MTRPATTLLRRLPALATPPRPTPRYFHCSTQRAVVKPFLLADIGEGIREVQIIQWFVQAGARVEQFDKLCEVQSDKASVEITSRFDGVIQKLHYEADDMAQVGKPLVDIDIQSEITPEDEALTTPHTNQDAANTGKRSDETQPLPESSPTATQTETSVTRDPSASSNRHATLATPAVRHLTKQLNVDIASVVGSGKDGRVLKEDVYRYSQQQDAAPLQQPLQAITPSDTTVPLTSVQHQMFKTMTRSLSIPHFLYSDSVDLSVLSSMRRTLNVQRERKLSSLAFIIKAASLALADFPILNARLEIPQDSSRPQLCYRGSHNIGIAVDTPQGLLVPVVKDVQSLSIEAVAAEIRRLSSLGREGKLSSDDLAGGTFTVSNVGSIGGGVVSPVIVTGQTSIVGVGKARQVPAFGVDGTLVKREECMLSWSADHRVVDGATLARAAQAVKLLLEEPSRMLIAMK